MWQYLHGWSSFQPFQNFIRFSTRQLLALFVNSAGALFERIVAFENSADGGDDGRCRRRHQQSGKRTVIQPQLGCNRKGFPASCRPRHRQQDFFFHADVSE